MDFYSLTDEVIHAIKMRDLNKVRELLKEAKGKKMIINIEVLTELGFNVKQLADYLEYFTK